MARYRATFDGERRSAGLTVQFTPTERQLLAERAAKAGAAMGEYVRELCLRPGRGAPVVAGTQRNPTAKALADELRAIGNNLNQLARVANQTGELRREGELSMTIDQLKATMARVITL
jgi:Mobilization protein NikA